MKIVFVANAICNTGGIDKVTIVKANALAALPANEVYIIVTDHYPDWTLSEPLSPQVHLIDLDVDYYINEKYTFWANLKDTRRKRQLHKALLTRELNRIKPDIVVGVGQSEKFMLPGIKGPWKTIREFHFEKHYRRKTARSAIDKIRARLLEFYEDSFILPRYDKVVVLTREQKDRFFRDNDRVVVMPNPITIDNQLKHNVLSPPIEARRNVVVSVGRLTLQKNYSMLIKAFEEVVRRHPDWALEIYGDGSERRNLQRQIEQAGLEDSVKLCGTTHCVPDVLRSSSIYCMSSLFEGFPLVLLEAAWCGLPIVSTSCPSGPRDFIADGKNGFLVDVDDSTTMADRICRLIENPSRRADMARASYEMSLDYTLDKITGRIMHLYTGLLLDN